MSNQNNIDRLFELLKHSKPEVSLEEATSRLWEPGEMLPSTKQNFYNIKTITMMTLLSSLIVSFWFMFFPSGTDVPTAIEQKALPFSAYTGETEALQAHPLTEHDVHQSPSQPEPSQVLSPESHSVPSRTFEDAGVADSPVESERIPSGLVETVSIIESNAYAPVDSQSLLITSASTNQMYDSLVTALQSAGFVANLIKRRSLMTGHVFYFDLRVSNSSGLKSKIQAGPFDKCLVSWGPSGSLNLLFDDKEHHIVSTGAKNRIRYKKDTRQR